MCIRDRRGTAPYHSRCRLSSRAEGYVVHKVLLELATHDQPFVFEGAHPSAGSELALKVRPFKTPAEAVWPISRMQPCTHDATNLVLSTIQKLTHCHCSRPMRTKPGSCFNFCHRRRRRQRTATVVASNPAADLSTPF